MGVILDQDPITGIRQVYHGSSDGESFTIESRQHTAPILEENKRLRNSVDERARWHTGQNRVASIPNVVYWDLVAKGIVDFKDPTQRKLMRWLDDRDNEAFRTRPGVLAGVRRRS